LFNTEVCVDASISGCSGKVFVFSVRYMLVGACVPIFFGQAEIDDVYQVTFFPQAHEEIVWLDIPMDEVFAVNELYPRNELVCQQQYGFEAESS